MQPDPEGGGSLATDPSLMDSTQRLQNLNLGSTQQPPVSGGTVNPGVQVREPVVRKETLSQIIL